MSDHYDKPEALRIKEQADERSREELEALKDGSRTRSIRPGSVNAPHADESPAEEHRGGPLPDMKR